MMFMVATGSDLCALRALVHNVQPEHCKFRSDLCSALIRRTACIIMIIIESVKIYGENPLRESTNLRRMHLADWRSRSVDERLPSRSIRSIFETKSSRL